MARGDKNRARALRPRGDRLANDHGLSDPGTLECRNRCSPGRDPSPPFFFAGWRVRCKRDGAEGQNGVRLLSWFS